MLATNGVNGPLKGIKVLDWTMWQMGPVATAMMGDMGADVIKIEALDGDAGRAVRRAITLDTGLVADRNAYFESGNRNKRGIAVDLKTGEGVEIVQKLAEKTDVFVQNFRQGVAERLGLGYDTLREINPMLVYGSASGYGPNGPDSNLPSFDGCGQARSGLMMSATPAGALEPNRVTQGASDQMGAIMLCLGVLAALVARNEQGVGQKVDSSHLGSNMWLQGNGITMSLLTKGGKFGSYERKKGRTLFPICIGAKTVVGCKSCIYNRIAIGCRSPKLWGWKSISKIPGSLPWTTALRTTLSWLRS